jgi:hypothetical protein
MMAGDMKPGKKVVVSEFAEDPLQAIDAHMSLQDMARPDPATLKAG